MQYHQSFVLDTDVLVAALRSSLGASRRLLLYGLEKRFRFLISVPLFLEYEAVLKRPRQLVACGLSRDDVDLLLADVAAVASPVRLAYRWRPALTDAGDDMVLEAAVNGGADAIVTFNLRHFRIARRLFDCDILMPRDALGRIRGYLP